MRRDAGALRPGQGEDVPRNPLTHAGLAVTGHPALVDEGDTVGLRVLPSLAEQRVARWGSCVIRRRVMPRSRCSRNSSSTISRPVS